MGLLQNIKLVLLKWATASSTVRHRASPCWCSDLSFPHPLIHLNLVIRALFIEILYLCVSCVYFFLHI